ncbi:hypothetical protein Mapa_001859 [Marchantia paleacea]|nr:hypothetical protein Mapa_001859 [Marchantia paleacea]
MTHGCAPHNEPKNSTRRSHNPSSEGHHTRFLLRRSTEIKARKQRKTTTIPKLIIKKHTRNKTTPLCSIEEGEARVIAPGPNNSWRASSAGSLHRASGPSDFDSRTRETQARHLAARPPSLLAATRFRMRTGGTATGVSGQHSDKIN